ncbi:3-oxoadipate enol-lactonase [uncultured Roseovarius sp.]|uniref:3-oxoadipate enol-lactonase n=1 Tax=uncultured Roseovarius sp. TaxID=293344 RepID=UPI00260F214A|nr:3-oxoadipate enol-lactonase [uncultured Roseovarius sp.]
MTRFARPGAVTLHYDHHRGDPARRPIVFANSLGTDLRIWDTVRSALPPDTPTLAMDKRGHGLSEHGPISIETLATDLAALMDHLALSDALLCGVSVGGMIAQSLAHLRPDLVAGLMLCNTGAQIGTAEAWTMRIDTVQTSGIAAMADAILERWFSPDWRAAHPVALSGWRQMLIRTPADGYAATCAAIRDADLTATTARLSLPTLCLAGSEDGATPPPLVEALADLIPGAHFTCLNGVGHLPCIEAPDRLTPLLLDRYDSLP